MFIISKKIFGLLLGIIVIIIIIVTLPNTKYPSGRDTVDLFGNDRFQILRGTNLPNALIDVETQAEIEANVYKYKKVPPLVYVLGKSGYTVLNYKTGVLEKNKKIEDIPSDRIGVFKNLVE